MPSMQLPLRGLKPLLPPLAGTEWGIRVACDLHMQQSFHADDDRGCLDDHKITTVIPAKAGIQCLSLNTRKNYFSRT